MNISNIPKIDLEGDTSNKPFVKFKQLNNTWTSSNQCLSVINGYTDLNGIQINGYDDTNTIISTVYSNISFGIKGTNTNFIFKKDNTELLKIANNGNVGIGTTDLDTYKLNINGDINSLNIYKNGTELNNIYLLISSNFWLKNNNNIYTDNLSNIINVGIGTSTPYANLHIYSSAANNTAKYTNDGTIIISKYDDAFSNVYNFKFGYIKDTNIFSFGNYTYTNTNSIHTWTNQFSINPTAPGNSLVIGDDGNIGIGTTSSSSYKVNINGGLNATSLIGDGSGIININYNNITNKPSTDNLITWKGTLNAAYLEAANLSIGSSTVNTSYRVNIIGKLNVTSDISENDVLLSNKYTLKSFAEANYLLKLDADTKYYFLELDSTSSDSRIIYFKDGYKSKHLVLGLDATKGVAYSTITNPILTVNGILTASTYRGDGYGITNINYNNIQNKPDLITLESLNTLCYTKSYMDTPSLYHQTISNITLQLSPKNADFKQLQTDVSKIYDNAVTPQLLQQIAGRFNESNGLLAVYYCNMINNPISYNKDINNEDQNINISSSYFGFGTSYDITNTYRVNVNGIIKTDQLKSLGTIYENSTALSNIYVSQAAFNQIAPLYDTIIARTRAIYGYENLYPPQNTLFNINSNTTITNSLYGNGFYKLEGSVRLNSNLSPPQFYSIFNSNINSIELSLINDYNVTIGNDKSLFNQVTNTSIFSKITVNENTVNIFGHWIQLYYSNMFIISELVIQIITADLISAPKKIYLLATDKNYITEYNNTTDPNWVLLLDNYIINTYTSINDTYSIISIPIDSNIKPYYYYRIIVSQLQNTNTESTILKMNQIFFNGYETKKEWINSGSNIYSYSNISIKTIDDNSPYALNVNGMIYSSNNIYTSSNIGIGTTDTLGNLHIGSITNSNDGTLIIAKHNGTTGRILKIGYDNSFNFIIGDYGSSGSLNWKPQFYINSNAPANSLIINSNGNIGIGTTIHTDINNIIYKLSINGSANIIGALNQDGRTNINKFSGDIYASNNVSIDSNLNAWRIYASNITTKDYINSYGVISSYSNVGIGISTSLLGSLHIQQSSISINNIWNSASNMAIGGKIKNFIGSNTSYGFYYNYNYNNSSINNNNNYLSWTTANNNQDVFNITNAGNIGIGTTTPSGILQVGSGYKFRISASDDDYAIIGLNNTDSINTKIHLIGSDKSITHYASNHIFYNFQKNEKIRIDTDGNVGISTSILTDSFTSTKYKLSINGSVYSSDKFDILNSISIGYNNSNGNLTIYKSTNNIFKFGFDPITTDFIMGNIVSNEWKKQVIINSSAPSSSLYINSIGRIGINNLNPLGTLHIGSNSDIIANNGSIVVSQKHSTGINRNFKFGYNDNYDFIFGDFGDNLTQNWKQQFYINSNASENSLMINSFGNTGIGIINPDNAKKLIVNGDTNIIGSFIQSGTNINNLFRGNVGIATDIINANYNFNVIGNANITNGIVTANISNSGYLINKSLVRIGPTVDTTTNYGYDFYLNTSTCIEANIDIKGTLKHTIGEFISEAISTSIKNNVKIGGLLGINIGTNTLTNLLQIEDGGKLLIANTRSDYTCIGTSNIESSTNTRIIINGSMKSLNPGNIEYYATTNNGKHTFYSNGGSTELMSVNSNGLNVSSNIRENNILLSNIYVKLDNLSNLSVSNYNLNKKYGYISKTSTSTISINGSNYYKFDIDLSSLKTITLSTSPSIIKYRSFNIKCFMNYGIFEMTNNMIPSILQYDIYMSNGQITPPATITNYKSGINIYAIGTPENFKLSNLLPCYITLLRTTDFNYLSIISTIPDLSVSYIIEDYIG
jgi:hypothetical protein